MYKFEFEECCDFDEAIKVLEKEAQEIDYLKNTKEHFIYTQYEWEAKLVAKLFKEIPTRFDCYFIKWQIKADFEESY